MTRKRTVYTAAIMISLMLLTACSLEQTKTMNPHPSKPVIQTENDKNLIVTVAPTNVVTPTIAVAPTKASQPTEAPTPTDIIVPTKAVEGKEEDGKEDSMISQAANELVAAMGNGWNLGNTMEAVGDWFSPSPQGFETCWGQPVTTYEMLSGIKACGFDSVRIPVAWSNMMSDDGTYTIEEAYFSRVDEIVGYVLDNDMYAVVNIHWDGGWWKDFGDKEESVREEAMKKYKAVWTQIAEHYKDYSHKLIFESANEELGLFSTNLTVSESYERVNAINQSFVDMVRASGSNNSDRFLLIAGYNTDIDKTCNSRYTMPTDTILGHLLISVHYYTPSTYCIASETTNSWGYMDSWGTDQNKVDMRRNLEKMQKFTKAGYGVVIGEYGVTMKKTEEDESVYKTGTEQFYAEMVKLCDEFNYCPMLWDTGASYNRTECSFAFEPLNHIYMPKDTLSEE